MVIENLIRLKIAEMDIGYTVKERTLEKRNMLKVVLLSFS